MNGVSLSDVAAFFFSYLSTECFLFTLGKTFLSRFSVKLVEWLSLLLHTTSDFC